MKSQICKVRHYFRCLGFADNFIETHDEGLVDSWSGNPFFSHPVPHPPFSHPVPHPMNT